MQFRECSINGIKYQEINGKLVPEGMTDDTPDASLPRLVRVTLGGSRTAVSCVCVCVCLGVNVSYFSVFV